MCISSCIIAAMSIILASVSIITFFLISSSILLMVLWVSGYGLEVWIVLSHLISIILILVTIAMIVDTEYKWSARVTVYAILTSILLFIVYDYMLYPYFCHTLSSIRNTSTSYRFMCIWYNLDTLLALTLTLVMVIVVFIVVDI